MLISVIIATRNRSKTLRATLESLAKQKSQGVFNLEIVVVDNNSSDDTKNTVEDAQRNISGKIRYLFEGQKGKAFAINAGIREAKGEILAFTDDDAVADEMWLWNIVECFKANNCDGLGGRILPDYSENTPRWIKEHARKLAGPIVLYDYGEDNKPLEKSMFEFLGANYAFRKNVFERFGFLRTDIGAGTKINAGEDTEFIKRLVKAKASLYYCGKAVVWHPVDSGRMSLNYLAWWYRGLGRFYIYVDGSAAANGEATWAGIPRYLIRQIITDALKLPGSSFNRAQLLDIWKKLFINVGRAQGIREKALSKGGKQ